jgi:hypothetical protein
MLNVLTNPILNEMLHDGRNIRIMEDYFYVDPQKVRWEIYKDLIVNGADKPTWLWSISGGPFVGKERIASIFHDRYCIHRLRAHKDVHNMFWFLMMDLGCDEGRADRRWFAVDKFGPKWDQAGRDEVRGKEEKEFLDSVSEEW